MSNPAQHRHLSSHYDSMPYPRAPIELEARGLWHLRCKHTPKIAFHHARSNRTRHPLRILDYGCGAGLGLLLLAHAEPTADLVGIDISRSSLGIADKRLKCHGVRANLVAGDASVLDDMEPFDYINCDEVAYLQNDPVGLLSWLRRALRHDGVLRVNFHNIYARRDCLRAQQALRLLGITGRESFSTAVKRTRDLFECLDDSVALRRRVWKHDMSESVLAVNHLMPDDHAWDYREVLEMVADSGLRLVRMLDENRWQVRSLFKPGKVPDEIEKRLQTLGDQEQRVLCSVLGYEGRLFDMWVQGHAATDALGCEDAMRRTEDPHPAQRLKRSIISVHPVLADSDVVNEMKTALRRGGSFGIGRYLPFVGRRLRMEVSWTEILLLLTQVPMSVSDLASRVVSAHPVDICTGARRRVGDVEVDTAGRVLQLAQMGAVQIGD